MRALASVDGTPEDFIRLDGMEVNGSGDPVVTRLRLWPPLGAIGRSR